MATILIIEDEIDFREAIEEHLQLEGYQVLAAGNGEEGYQKILSHTPDIILSDIQMPEMDGFSLITRLRMEHPEHASIPFIFMTSYTDDDHILRGRKLGCDDYITKPVRFSVLSGIIENRLSRTVGLQHFYSAAVADFQSELLSLITHEFRTSLNAIIGFSDLMLSCPDTLKDTESLTKYLSEINRCGYKQLQLVEALTESLMLAVDSKAVNMEVVDAETLFTQISLMANKLQRPGVAEIAITLDENLPEISVDRRLFTNACLWLMADMVESLDEKGALSVCVSSHAKTITVGMHRGDAPASADKFHALPSLEEAYDALSAEKKHRKISVILIGKVAEAHDIKIHVELSPKGAIEHLYLDIPHAARANAFAEAS